ncbi:MAG: hypothetical protein WC876_03295 [Candidatus Thermoplasmatota archaeon]
MRGLLVMLVVVFAAVAGCAEGAGDTEPTETPSVITDPRDFSDANSTGAHLHDYWGGADSLDVLDYSRQSTWNNGGGTFNWRVLFSPPDERVIPQGTASLSVKVDWTDTTPANRYAGVSLWVKPANSAEHQFIQEVSRGTTVEVPVQYDQADLPHQLISAWEFAIQYNSTGGPNLFFGSTHVTVVAHRGLELQPFPAHPDRWMGRTSFDLLSASGSFMNVGYTGSGSLPERFRPENGTVVPSDAAYVDVTLTLDNQLPAGGLQLTFHAANSRSWTLLEPESDQAGVRHYTIQIEPGMGDGPYNNASLWEFQIYTPNTAPGNDPAVYDGSYELTVVVHKPGA